MERPNPLGILHELFEQVAQGASAEQCAGFTGDWLLAHVRPIHCAIFAGDGPTSGWRRLWAHGLSPAQVGATVGLFSAPPPPALFPTGDGVQGELSVWLQPLRYGPEELGAIWIDLGNGPSAAAPRAEWLAWGRDLLAAVGGVLSAKLACLAITGQNGQELARLRARSERLAALNRVAQALAATLDTGELCQIAHRAISQLMDCPNLGISTYDSEQQLISPLYLIGDGVHIDSSGLRPVPLEPETGVQSKVIVSKRPLLIPDLEDLRGEIKNFQQVHTTDRRQARSVIAAPMVAGERVIGTLQIQNYTPDSYSEDDVELLGAIANQLGVALENSQLFATAQRRLRDLEMINRLHASLRSVKDLDTLLVVLLDEILAIVQTSAGAIWLQIPGSDQLVEKAARGWFQQLPRKHMLVGEGITGQVFARGKILQVPAYVENPHILQVVDSAVPAGWGGAAFPLYTETERMGVLHVGVQHPRHLSPEEVHLIAILGEIASAAIQRAALYGQMEIQSRLAAVGQMAAGIAHDFNNILSVIVLYVELLQRSPRLLDDDRQRLSTIQDQAEQASALIQQILDFSRRAIMKRVQVDLGALITEEESLLRRTLPANIQVFSLMEKRPFPVMADPVRLRQVLMNLALNARDAMPDGGVMGLTLERVTFDVAHPPPLPEMAEGVWLRLAVRDTGQGVHPSHLAHIFEPFFTTKPPGQGTGLGLAQVYGIVKQHGGHISVESQLDQGTAFFIFLPASAP